MQSKLHVLLCQFLNLLKASALYGGDFARSSNIICYRSSCFINRIFKETIVHPPPRYIVGWPGSFVLLNTSTKSVGTAWYQVVN